MSTYFHKLPQDVLLIIAEFLYEPCYKLRDEFIPYVNEESLLYHPKAISYIPGILDRLDKKIENLPSDYRPLASVLVFTLGNRPLMDKYLVSLSKNKNDNTFPILLKYLTKYPPLHSNVLNFIIDNLLIYGGREAINWVAVNYLSKFNIKLLLLNKKDYFKECYEIMSKSDHFKLSYSSFYTFLQFPHKEEIISYLKQNRDYASTNRTSIFDSPHVLDIISELEIIPSVHEFTGLLRNPAPGILNYALRYPDLLEKYIQCLISNPNDEVIDYLYKILLPINKSKLYLYLEELLSNPNERIEPLILTYLTYYLENRYLPERDRYITFKWSGCTFPNVVKILHQHPEFISWYRLSSNHSDIAVQILKENIHMVELNQLVMNTHPDTPELILNYIQKLGQPSEYESIPPVFIVDKESTSRHLKEELDKWLE